LEKLSQNRFNVTPHPRLIYTVHECNKSPLE